MKEQTKYKMVPLTLDENMRNALRTGSRKDCPSDELCDVRYAALLAAAPDASPCIWTHDENEYCDKWDSACGESWSFTEGGPVENNFRFCHGCGRPVSLPPFPIGEQE